ncbi:MAG: acireductone synthase [Bacteriovoracaceae bacterium]
MNRKLFLFDIEGTTTDFNFVHKTLFPYARERMREYVTAHEQDLSAPLAEARKTIEAESGKTPDLNLIMNTLIQWIDEDRKHKALKDIQGRIWEEGYKSGAFKGHVYSDVKPFFENLNSSGYRIGIYSSGSVQAQKLILANSTEGDLTPYINYYFDTAVGQKRDKVSYQNIAIKTQLTPPEIHFFSDVPEELKAAELAGFRVTHVLREGTRPSKFSGIKNFAEFKF